jgi:hypothetical protein
VLTISVRHNVPSKRLIAQRIVFRRGKRGTEKKIEDKNRTGLQHDEQ